MTAYLLGNIIGRVALSYAIIWIGIFLGLARLNWRDAFRRTNHWGGLTAIATISLLGIVATQFNGVAQ